ncbi:MAG: hypothetical protein HOH20_11455 [Rhodospirillaceae bacterium]|nr:hypothetical protein [Rhodospirillaceae bacterium]MBT5564786.1 hypothetical protein [Rhodospirillaceae bacterium]MBT6090185.1 hypothetical protein [Rhodospirillaceae bacterium]MBT6962401.1 hypothetical protein [Rhodospirillaceae bacterium]
MVAAPGLFGPAEKVWIPKGRPSPFHDGPTKDQLLSMVMALTVEVSVLRERLDTHERVSEAKGGFGTKDVEEYNADTAANGERSSLRSRIMQKVFRILRQETARLETEDENYDEIMKEFDDV